MARVKTTTNGKTQQVNTTTDVLPVSVGKGGLAGQIVSHLVGKAVPYAAPWAGAYTLPPLAGFATNQMWGDTALEAGLASAGLGIGAVVLSAVTWQVAGGTNKFRKFRRAQATASVAAGMGWLTCATAAGPFGHPMIDAWLLGGGVFAASWNIRQLMRNAHDETEQVEEKGGLAKIAEAIGLEKLKVKAAKGNEKGMVKAPIEIPAGQTIEDVQAALPKLATALHVPPSGATVTGDPDNAAHGVLNIRVADLLKDGVQFIPPIRLGMLPTDDLPLGLYADGETFIINPFDAPILQHLLVMGVTGAGKSEFARGLLAHLATRRKMSVMLIDCSKGRQSVGHIKHGLDVFISDMRQAKHLLKALPGAIKARGDVLADEGLDQWTPKSSLNAVCLWIEEAADVADFDELDKIARAARSVGIWLVISLQRATWTNISTDVRANLQAFACFGVDKPEDASFGMPDRVTDAGAIPAWGSDRPGYAFAGGMGIPEGRWTTEWRSGLTDRDYLAELVTAATPFRDPLDDTTAQSLGLVYAQRDHRGTNRANTDVSELPPAMAQPRRELPEAGDVEALTMEQEESIQVEIEDAYAEVMGMIPGDPEPDAPYANLDIDGDMPEDSDTGLQFEQREKLGAEEARQVIHEQIHQWALANQLTFQPADLAPATVKAGRKRPWLQGELGRLVEAGILRHDRHGEYDIVQSPLVPA
ncbi:FtsK/SpoIIIE domain-containing protein [Streptomyces scabiei]|uniref:FtsK/SpoIIIE domain-containing protein n=1 Tax=Streptomyces scabiei TaxID=1930 RepID=UPI0029ACCCDF|nr:FtsK/SpoIIIE domain-containing protein [Streptomyces scabiei]MDX3047548.1 FtsK/SpoIIIE domain-containing protein [Streptomyces scabiei]